MAKVLDLIIAHMKKLFAILFLFLVFFSFTPPVFADWESLRGDHPCTELAGGGQGRVVTIDCIPPLFANIIYWLLVFSGTVALFFVIFGGIKYLTSGGDPKQTEGARKTIMWALVGLAFVLFSFAIVRIIAEQTGVGCITKFGFGQCV